jgi:hypothetical protein
MTKSSDEQNEQYEERAAIKEFCGNMTREEAEKQAREEVFGLEERDRREPILF